MNGRAWGVGLLCVAATLCGGCFRVARQGLSEIVGARGELLAVRELGSDVREQVRRLRFEPATTTLTAALCPPKLLAAIDEGYAREAADWAEDYGGSGTRTLRVATDILFYEEKGLLDSAELLARVKVYDSGSLAGDTLVRVTSSSFRAGGKHALGRALAHTVVKMFRKTRRAPTSQPQDS